MPDSSGSDFRPDHGATAKRAAVESAARADAPVPVSGKKTNPVDKLAKSNELYIAFGVVVFFGCIFAAGRVYWDERYYIPEEGLGYFLGLTGGIIMLLAMTYSMFKHAPTLRSKIKIKTWLNAHIAMGLAGPLLIYFHSTFRFGSLNGGVALVSMSLVLLSGIIGRFLYSKTHYGLGGRKAKLGELHKLLNDENGHIHSPRLHEFTQNVLKHSTSLLQATWELISYGIRRRWVYFLAKKEMLRKLKELALANGLTDKEIRKQKRAIKYHLRNYLVILHKVALFKLYERFFAFWRHAHVPLLYLLLISGIVHVIAVHMY
ncbi:MAG: hypothetical protein L0Z73_01240 [Gammaproteobacteria bacterium]|nr:hypothetical protein [Gammaproteobacteria bacterium]